MFYETVDLYEYFSVPREGKTGGLLTVYARNKYKEIKEKIRPAMLVLPGGGYGFVSEREAEPIAVRFMLAGYAAFVLNYTIHAPFPTPLIEAAMAMAFIRENAEKYGADREHAGGVGFWAGGHLTGMLATMFADERVKKALGKRASLARPDAVVLSYPVITTGEFTHGGTAETISGGDAALRKALSVEERVTEESSPAFIWHTAEDNAVPVENSLLLANAYRKKGVPFELHVFAKGWHGLSEVGVEVFDDEPAPEIARNAAWFDLALSFLKTRGFCVSHKD